MSPVNDAYHKPGLLPAHHRIAMCQRAVAESDIAMVDTWEAAQPDAQRSLVVLDRVQQAVQRHYDNATAAGPDQHQCDQQANGKAKHSSDHRLDERPQTAETPCNNLAALGNVQQQHPKSQVIWPLQPDFKKDHQLASQTLGCMVVSTVAALLFGQLANAVVFAYDCFIAPSDAIR